MYICINMYKLVIYRYMTVIKMVIKEIHTVATYVCNNIKYVVQRFCWVYTFLL